MGKEQKISIRIFQDQDANHVSKMIRNTMLVTNSKDYPMSIIKPLQDYFSPSKLKSVASERYCLVAEISGEIVGTGAIEVDQLKTIFVSSKYHGWGIGKKLIESLETYAISNQIKVIKVPSSITGIGFYEKMGYKKGETFLSKNAGRQTWMTKTLI